MVDNDFEVLKLDDYNSKNYQQELGCAMALKGADACFESHDKLYIIEFKNTYMSDKVIYEVMEKMYASCIVIMDKLTIDLNRLRQNVSFVTVYNYEDNPKNENLYSEINQINNKGYDKIKMAVARRSNRLVKEMDTSAFGLKKLEKYIYHEVNAIPANFFQQYLIEEGIQQS
ncbi:MAG: hypothetical protein LUG60_02665 [Erysipelotrichaceae bacterium]|nr:hypothetical protein [Erysipelotrichaceae bacterium]